MYGDRSMKKMKQFMKNNKGAIYLGDVLLALALILGATALGMTLLKTSSKGDPGPQGMQGEQGFTGATGKTGPAGDTGMTGPRGLNGSRGTNGTNGRNGSDYVNHPSTMNITVLSGSYKDMANGTLFTFNITVVTHDRDNDTARTTIFYKRNQTDVWQTASLSWGLNASQVVQVNYLMTMPSNQRLYWSAEAWDGADITLKTMNYLVVYP
jgi:hypothetical protein